MRSFRIAYVPRPDATPEGELSALAAIYRLVLDSKKAARPGGPDDAMKGPKKHDRARTSIPE